MISANEKKAMREFMFSKWSIVLAVWMCFVLSLYVKEGSTTPAAARPLPCPENPIFVHTAERCGIPVPLPGDALLSALGSEPSVSAGSLSWEVGNDL